jgi:DnaJ-domain-containing protein 1
MMPPRRQERDLLRRQGIEITPVGEVVEVRGRGAEELRQIIQAGIQAQQQEERDRIRAQEQKKRDDENTRLRRCRNDAKWLGGFGVLQINKLNSRHFPGRYQIVRQQRFSIRSSRPTEVLATSLDIDALESWIQKQKPPWQPTGDTYDIFDLIGHGEYDTRHYDTLGVDPEASDDEIKRAYRRLARQNHPDVNSDPEAKARFNAINLAYEALINNPTTR